MKHEDCDERQEGIKEEKGGRWMDDLEDDVEAKKQ